MIACTYVASTDTLSVDCSRKLPAARPGEALVRILRAGICRTDLEICRGYVPGFDGVLGHEFCGRVTSCDSAPHLVGRRVVGEINCNDAHYTCADAIFQRNHAPGRSVLGIIGRDGAMAEFITLPATNLHLVPDELSDQQACFAEPLAAACRIVEQGWPKGGSKVAVLGDGKLGLLVTAVLALQDSADVTLFGRHSAKMALLPPLRRLRDRLQTEEPLLAGQVAAYDLVVEATGSASGIRTALAMTKPMGALLLKSTVSAADAPPSSSPACAPSWSEVANDIVVNEKQLLGSRCGPIHLALEMLAQHESLRQLVDAMTTRVFHARDGVAAMEAARQKGVLKVQLSFEPPSS